MNRIPVEVMKMYDIRRDPIQFLKELSGGSLRVETEITESSGFDRLNLSVKVGHEFFCQRVLAGSGIIKDIILDSLPGKQLTDGNHNFSRTATAANRIDLYDLHNIFILTKSFHQFSRQYAVAHRAPRGGIDAARFPPEGGRKKIIKE